MLPAQPNQSLIGGLDCLQAVITAGEPIGSRDVARRLGLEHTRVSRLLGTLKHLGLVEQTPDRKYRPGPGVHLLSAQSLHASGLLRAALPHLDQFRDERLLVAMGVLWGGQVCYLLHGRSDQPLGERLSAHEPHPAHRSIIGLAMLAALSDGALRRALKEDFELPAGGIRALRDDIRRTREQGYAMRDAAGQVGLAVTVGAPPVAAISLTGHIDGRRVGKLVRQLQVAAEAISAELGVRGRAQQ
jgi:DNA-binding IclR family transcriptional regulator